MIRYFAHHPTAANLLMASIVILGLLSASTLTRGLFPEYEVPIVQITTAYPGASAEETEQSICVRIEEQIEGLEGIKRIESQAREGIGLTTVTLTDDADPSEVRSRIDEELSLLTDMPDLAEDTVVELADIQLDVLFVAIAGDVPERDLLAYAEQLRDELLLLDDVSDVTITGFSDHELRVEVHETAMRAHGLSLSDFSSAIRAQSLDLPGGDVGTGQRDVKVRVTDQRRWAEQFRDTTIVSNTTGATIPLRALAEVRDTFKDDWDYATYNGERAAHLKIGTRSGEDVLSVANRVKEFLAKNATRYPEGIEIGVWRDNSTILEGRWTMLVENITAGVLLVFFTLWFFLNWRLSLWVALGIPISFLGALWVIDLEGMALDMISMIGLILAIGLIVDDAIVIAENVFAHRNRGESGADAAVNGTQEVTVGVISSLLTTLAIFLPLLFLEGTYGKVMNVIPYCVIVTLCVSLIEAFLILPNHLSHALAGADREPGWLRKRIDNTVHYVRDSLYGELLEWSLRNRLITFAFVAALSLVAAGIVAGGRISFRPMPDMDTSWIVATIRMPEGVAAERTREVADRVESSVEALNVRFSQHEVGGAQLVQHVAAFYGSTADGGERGSHIAEVWIEMIDTEFRVARLDDVAAYWRQTVGDIADVQQLTYEQPVLGPPLKPIKIALLGDDLETLERAGAELQEQLAEYAGVKNLQSDLRAGKEEVRVRLKESAHALGANSSLVGNQLRAGFFGEHVQQFQRGDEFVDVSVMLHPRDRSSLADIEYFPVRTPAGTYVPLYEIAHAELIRGYASMSRLDGKPVVHISADVDPTLGNASNILRDLSNQLFPQLENNHAGLTVRLRGEAEEVGETIGGAIRRTILGLVAIYVVLSFAFRSYLEPFIVLLAIPLGVIGVIVGHLLLGMDMSIFSVIGLISLTGILVNDSIVMVEFIKLRLAEGLPAEQAFARAGRERFRAVVLTTATTFMGLLPMLLETSLQATIFKGLVVSIMFGELFSTAMILVIIPCSYSLLNDLGWISGSSAGSVHCDGPN